MYGLIFCLIFTFLLLLGTPVSVTEWLHSEIMPYAEFSFPTFRYALPIILFYFDAVKLASAPAAIYLSFPSICFAIQQVREPVPFYRCDLFFRAVFKCSVSTFSIVNFFLRDFRTFLCFEGIFWRS